MTESCLSEALNDVVKFVPVQVESAHVVANHRYFQPEVPSTARTAYTEWVRSAIENGIYHGWFAVHQGDTVGGAGLVLLDWGPTRNSSATKRARVVNVWVDPLMRRRGIARALTRLACQQAQRMGVTTVSLSSTAMSRSLYASLGFEPAVAEMTLTIPSDSTKT